MRHLSEISKDERAATAVEYGLILAMIFLAMAVGVAALGSGTSGLWANVADQVKKA